MRAELERNQALAVLAGEEFPPREAESATDLIHWSGSGRKPRPVEPVRLPEHLQQGTRMRLPQSLLPPRYTMAALDGRVEVREVDQYGVNCAWIGIEGVSDHLFWVNNGPLCKAVLRGEVVDAE